MTDELPKKNAKVRPTSKAASTTLDGSGTCQQSTFSVGLAVQLRWLRRPIRFDLRKNRAYIKLYGVVFLCLASQVIKSDPTD